jgi:MoaA/NifB/PqqE/SkfB family radical SAM enzyme
MKKDKQLILDDHKLIWHRDRLDAWLRGERVAPITIDCALTRRCTYRCMYCYSTLQANHERIITQSVIDRFLDDAAEIGVKAVSFVSDGESTCSPHLYDAILRGRSNGLDMALGTNGYLLKDSKLEEMLPALTYLRFNISGSNWKRYAEIHGCAPKCYHKVINTIRNCVRIKKEARLDVTLGMQMVLLPQCADQILPLAKLGRDLGVDYLVIKHCSDDETGTLNVDYEAYHSLVDSLKEAETISTDTYRVSVKWSKILSGGTRNYARCYGPPFIMQLSGSGLVAPCGMLFNTKHARFHIGNIVEQSFKEIWESDRYGDVMHFIASERFDARTMCGSLCLQHKVNEYLDGVKRSGEASQRGVGEPPMHINFI